ncbi:MAG: V-type ATP synthase subunit E [Atribacterota bacterium]
MPIKDIKDKILADAQNEKDSIIKKAEEYIKDTKENLQNEINSIKKEIMERYEQDAELKEKKIITEARLKANKEILSEKQAIIEEIFKEVENRIRKLDEEKYVNLIEKLILENIENGDETIYIGNQERKSINQKFIDDLNKKLKSQGKQGELKLSKKNVPIKGGIILGTDEIRKNASLEIILEKIKEDIEIKLNQYLFQKDEE